jgi:predicted dehydrogenase
MSVRIGLLGASRVASYAVIAPAASINEMTISCVAARDAERARSYAREHDIPATEAGYVELVRSDQVDLVYNGLPPSEHARWTIAALEAGKDVLCEKPFAMNAAEAQAMVDAAEATGGTLIEAFHYRFHPLFRRVLELVQGGLLGEPQHLEAHFNVAIQASNSELRYQPELGGGALMDLGCYPLHWLRTVTASEPTVRSATAIRHDTGVDVSMEAELHFPGGVSARVSTSMSESLPEGLDAGLVIEGTRGRLTVVNPIAPHLGHELRIERAGSKTSRETCGSRPTYDYQLRHVLGVLEGNVVPVTGGDDAVANMRLIDDIYLRAGMRQ